MEKVLIYALSENVGGVEEYVMNLLRYSIGGKDKYGYFILGENSPYEEELIYRETDYYFIPKKKNIFKNIFSSISLLKRLRSEYDTVYFNTSAIGYLVPYLICIHYRYKIVLHSHSDCSKTAGLIKKMIHRLNYGVIKKKIGAKFACSSPAAKWMFHNDLSNVVVIPNAIQLDRFIYDEYARKQIKEKFGFKNELILGNVARLCVIKNQKFLIAILSELIKMGKNVKLVLVGDGEMRTLLEKQVVKLKLDQNVIFWGRTKEPEYVMNCMDCIVLPSISEGFPISVVEAQAAGIQCFVANTVTEEVNITGDVHFVSLEESPSNWAKMIVNVDRRRHNNIELLRELEYDVKDLENKVWTLLKDIK
ncbi:MAG: glycosyltransferase [Velocimicrobium sp.]